MPEPDHVRFLDGGVAGWNEWRRANAGVAPRLAGADLSRADLAGADLSDADLEGADLFQCDLGRANLKMANLARVDLSESRLAGADLYKADLSESFLTGADLSEAYVAEADLTGTDLRGARLVGADLSNSTVVGARLVGADLTAASLQSADITGADLSHANLTNANVFGLRYGSFRSMRGRYFAVRGLDSCYGNALFQRDARDQDYLETLERRIAEGGSSLGRGIKRSFLRAWSWIDYGRSLGRPALYAFVVALMFGILYSFDMRLDWGLMDYSSSSQSWLAPFYYSMVTYTTLGFGDITPATWVGELIVVVEVVLGYTTLGLLLAILANRVARRA